MGTAGWLVRQLAVAAPKFLHADLHTVCRLVAALDQPCLQKVTRTGMVTVASPGSTWPPR